MWGPWRRGCRSRGGPGGRRAAADWVLSPGARERRLARLPSLRLLKRCFFPEQQLAQIEADLKARTAAYSALQATLDSLSQKAK